jgi:hypothetical protein
MIMMLSVPFFPVHKNVFTQLTVNVLRVYMTETYFVAKDKKIPPDKFHQAGISGRFIGKGTLS